MENTLKSEAREEAKAEQKSNKLIIAAFSVIALAGLTGLGYLYATTLPLDYTIPEKTVFPIKGEGIEISEAKTAWRKVPEGLAVEAGTLYHPGVTLKLGSATKSAKLLCFYTNQADEPIGSGKIFRISSGKFENGKDTQSIWGSSGFKHESFFRHYRYKTEDKEKWKFVIKQIADDDKETILARVPVSTHLIENN